MINSSRFRLCLSLLLAGVGLVSAGAGATESRVIELRSARIETTATPRFGESPDPSLELVQFPGPLSAEQMRSFEATMERIYTYLPQHSYLVRTCAEGTCGSRSRASLHSELSEIGAIWSGPFRTEYKISPEIARSEGESSTLRSVLLHIFPEADLEQVGEAVQSLVGKRPVASGKRDRFSRVRILLTDAEIAASRDALAELGEVFWIEREARKVLLNDSTIWVGQSGLDAGQATPVFDRGLHGEGQIVAVLDTGLDADSCYFWDESEGLPPANCSGATVVDDTQRKVLAVDFLWSSDCNGGISVSEWDNQGHGTHVAGTVAGDEDSSPGTHNAYDGMAPAAKLVIQDGGFASGDPCADLPGLGCPVIDLVPIFQQAYDQGARIHTNSWGDEENDPTYGEYTAGSEDADQFMWDHPDFLLLFAAGNNGGTSHTVDSPSTAKSPISVGSTLSGASADSISGFSSRGPTLDGRIKPDLTNPGSTIRSAANNGNVSVPNCTDNSNSGTSMATPGVAGFAALVRQYFVDGFYPSGVATPGNSFTPSAALVKGILINSATEMTNAGQIPNDTQGWGRVLLDSALYFEGDERSLRVEEDPVGFANGSAGSSQSFELIVDSPNESLEVTLAWTDFPSTPMAATNLVNDLDLVVSGPDGTYRGNVFANGSSAAGGSADRLNTVENVLLEAPTPGLYTVTVEAFTVPGGASQPFALVASGPIVTCDGVGQAAAAQGTESMTAGGGDGDAYLDNCEGGRIGFSVLNRGDGAASNVSVVSVSSPSHPGTVFAPAAWSMASIPACSLDTSAFVDIEEAAGLLPGEILLVDVEITNDEIAPATTTTTLSVESTELDLVVSASLEFDFETDLEGWTATSGTFSRDDALGGAGGSVGYLQSSSALANQCDSVLSPPLYLSASSSLTLWTHYEIESGTPWYDRANISIVDEGATSLLEPTSGRDYDVPPGSPNGPCGMSDEAGWAGTRESWASSSFDAVELDSANRTDRPIHLQIDYGTDGGLELGGFRFDRLSLTDVGRQEPDAQSNVCAVDSIFSDAFESGDIGEWSASQP